MDWQIVIVIIIISFAAAITVIRTVRFFTTPVSHCSGCNKAGNHCSLEELKSEVIVKNAK